ncbi:MAG: phosphatase PAP2-related protein [Candidatus Hydrogenedentota bacterium]
MTKRRILRALLVVVSLGAWFGTQALIGSQDFPEDQIGDRVHQLTAPLHGWLLSHKSAASLLLIVSSALIDGLGIFLLGRAILGPSIRPLVALLIVFGLRQVCQLTCALPPPDRMIWYDPGVPSLLVTYGVSNDLFFSGHTSIAVLGALELARAGKSWGMIGILVALFEAATVLILRAHYTMDVITALFAALFASAVADRLSARIDRHL